MTTDLDLRALSVPCTLCGARIQRLCVDEQGNDKPNAHEARITFYERLKAAHTPGPWIVATRRRDDPQRIDIQETNEAGFTVASAWGGGPLDTALGANAALIAAVPELLDSARYFDYAAENINWQRETVPDDEVIVIRVTAKALRDNFAAIAKAEGRYT